MQYRIRKNNIGIVLEKGNQIQSQPNPFGVGYIMPGFMVYELRTFYSLAEVIRYIVKSSKKGDIAADIVAYGEDAEFFQRELQKLKYDFSQNKTYLKEVYGKKVELKIIDV